MFLQYLQRQGLEDAPLKVFLLIRFVIFQKWLQVFVTAVSGLGIFCPSAPNTSGIVGRAYILLAGLLIQYQVDAVTTLLSTRRGLSQ